MWRHLKETKKPIVLYGMGDGADKIMAVLSENGISVSGVFVSDGFVRNKLYKGMPLMSYAQAKERFGDMIVLVSFGSSIPEVIDNIKRIASEQELFVPDVPVYGNNLFDVSFARANKDKLQSAYNSMADEPSRFVFENTVLYKLTGRPELLFECESTIAETYKLLGMKSGETVVDCGAYTGDTAMEYIEHVGVPKKLYAIEPDIKTYKKLCQNCEEHPFISCINAAVTHSSGKISFSVSGSRSSRISREGIMIDAVSIDALLNGECPNYIKMDVEGNEKQAIEGATLTIQKYKPKLFISCYHRSEDIFDLPLQILNIRPDYKIHMVHYPYLPAWDTAFVCI